MIVCAEPQTNIAGQVHTRSLAASCAACHGTNGNSSGNAAKLAGIDSAYFIAQMQAFKSGERASTVMHRHAKGLTPQEIANLAEYFSVQVPSKPSALPSQKLSSNAHN
ncbi:MAG TPA: c-type cytochrome [Methylotenera sp.]|nr:c-type cytochrome [Methylotenera sp.]